MVAPVSVTLLADLSAQPADSSVEPTVGEVVTAAAVPLEPIPITRTSVRLTSRIARIRCSGMGGSLLADVNDMRGLLLGLLPHCSQRRWKTNCTQPPPLASAFCTYSSRVESLVAFLGLGGVRVAYGPSGGMVSA